MKPSFCHLFRRFSVTMEPHCALKAAKHLFKNKGYYHHNANDRFGFKTFYSLPTREGGGRVFLFHIDLLAVDALLGIAAQPNVEGALLYAEVHICIPHGEAAIGYVEFNPLGLSGSQ